MGLLGELRLAAQWAGYLWPAFWALPANPRWMTAQDVTCQAFELQMYRYAMTLEAMRWG